MFNADDEGVFDDRDFFSDVNEQESSTAEPDLASINLSGAQTDSGSRNSSQEEPREESRDKWTQVCVDSLGNSYHIGDIVYWAVKDEDNAFGMIGKIAGPSVFYGNDSVLVKFKQASALNSFRNEISDK